MYRYPSFGFLFYFGHPMNKDSAKQKGASRVTKPEKKPVAWLAGTPGILLSLGALVAVTLVVYSSCFKAGFINWDEKRYLFETPMIQMLSWENLKLIFTEKVLLSYNPLVSLSFALDYAMVGHKPEWYHILNILLHVLNSVVLFFVMRKLTGKLSFAVIVSFLFALHPMHVESVAWVASRKDVLYTLFYFLAWLCYLHSFIPTQKRAWYFLSLFLFTLSLLSKSQAVTLPLVLFMSQWLYHRKWDKKYLIQLIPFFVLSFAIGYFTLQGAAASADKYAAPLSFLDKIWYSILAAGMYLYKAFLPINQSAIYAFPGKGTSEFSLLLALAAVLIVISLWAGWKYRKTAPGILFGVAFFYLHTFLILHVLATNSSLIYERFTYVSYVGLFFAVASFYNELSVPRQKSVLGYGLAAALVLFSYATWARTAIWKSSETLWSDVIAKNQASDAAYNNRGEYYYTRGEFDKAFADYTSSIQVNPRQPNPYNNRSVILLYQKKFAEALKDNTLALKLEPEFTAAYNNRGNIYYNSEQYDSAIVYFTLAVKREPEFAAAWCNLGSSYLQKGNFPVALEHYRKAIAINPIYDEAFRYMGISYIRMDSLEKAMTYFSKSQQLNPQGNAMKILSDEYLKKGSEAFKNNDREQALTYYARAAEINPSEAEAYYCIGGVWFAKGDAKKAREFWKRTLQYNPEHKDAKMWLERIGN